MQILKIVLGILALLVAWAYVFRHKIIFAVNAWMREYVFSDHVVLFSGRRLAALLFLLGGLAVFSGISGVINVQVIKPNIAAQMLEEARSDLKKKRYSLVVNRCKELVRSNPREQEAWEMLVIAWWAMGEKDLAKQAAESLLRIDPSNALGKGPIAKILDKRLQEQQSEEPE